MTDFNYPYAYGKLNTTTFFLASDMVREGLITEDQYEKIRDYIDKRLEKVEKEVEEYSRK